jgi:hypothetical protein
MQPLLDEIADLSPEQLGHLSGPEMIRLLGYTNVNQSTEEHLGSPSRRRGAIRAIWMLVHPDAAEPSSDRISVADSDAELAELRKTVAKVTWDAGRSYGIEQSAIMGALRMAGLEPPHPGGQRVTFQINATVDLPLLSGAYNPASSADLSYILNETTHLTLTLRDKVLHVSCNDGFAGEDADEVDWHSSSINFRVIDVQSCVLPEDAP